MSTLGERIKKARIKKGLSQEQLAQIMDTTKSTISKYELDRREPSMSTIQKLTQVLDVPLTVLFGVTDENGFITADLFADPDDFEFIKLLGLNDPHQRTKLFTSPPSPPLPLRLENAFYALNARGQQVAVERVEELTEIPKYQKDPPPEDSGNG